MLRWVILENSPIASMAPGWSLPQGESPAADAHLTAYNRFDTDAIVATYAPDALVYDFNREFWGIDAIRAWIAKEIVGDRVTIEVIEVREHHGTTIVRGRYDGTY